MQETKLTVRVPSELLENLRRYASEHNTTMSALIKAYLRSIPPQAPADNAPIVQRLSGFLSQEVSVGDHKKHLEEKYAG